MNHQRQLSLSQYHDYSREEVHDIFAFGTPFTPQAGTWGLHGIVAIPSRPNDFVFFVTFGQSQGDHVFDEGVTEDGVLSWQSQPRQGFGSEQIQQLIRHDELQNSIVLFLRTNKRHKYTYLGRLKYLSHFLDTGMRLGELSRLQMTDVNLEDGFVLVHGKGGKDRYVPIGRSTIKCLWKYIKTRAIFRPLPYFLPNKENH